MAATARAQSAFGRTHPFPAFSPGHAAAVPVPPVTTPSSNCVKSAASTVDIARLRTGTLSYSTLPLGSLIVVIARGSFANTLPLTLYPPFANVP